MWILFALLAAVSAAVVVTLSKIGIKNVDSTVAFAIQSVMILLVAWGTVIGQGNLPELAKMERKTWIFLLVAGVVTCLSSLFSFRALKLGDASRVSPLTNLSLVFAVGLAALFLKERLSWQLIVGALLMGGGAVLIALSGGEGK